MGRALSKPTSKPSALIGRSWTNTLIYFNTETGEIVRLGVSDLDLHVNNLLTNEQILWVYAYGTPLHYLNLTGNLFLFYHLCIIFETQNWIWSIEKNVTGIIIQRSTHLLSHTVIGSLFGIRRLFIPKLIDSDYAKLYSDSYVTDLINLLKTEIDKPYHIVTSNCQQFGTLLFDHMAIKKKLDLSVKNRILTILTVLFWYKMGYLSSRGLKWPMHFQPITYPVIENNRSQLCFRKLINFRLISWANLHCKLK